MNIAKEFAVALRGMPKDDHALLQNLMLALAMKMLSRTQMGCYFEDDEKIGRFHSQYDSMNEAMLEILNGAKAADTTWARDIADMQQTIREVLAAYKADRASGDYQVWSLIQFFCRLFPDNVLDALKIRKRHMDLPRCDVIKLPYDF